MSVYLKQFAHISRISKEYQGHGWGCAYLTGQVWSVYKNICPIWEDNLDLFGESKFLLAHTRSAFKDKGISLMNNMPFYNKELIFAFNGELHGVRIKEEGRIGAEKIFNTIRRFSCEKADLLEAFKKAMCFIKKRTAYIKAMNIIFASKDRLFINTLFNEQANYFSMYKKESKQSLIISSRPLSSEQGWRKIPNRTIWGSQ